MTVLLIYSNEEELEYANLIEDKISRGLSLKMISADTGIPYDSVVKITKYSGLLEYPDELD